MRLTPVLLLLLTALAAGGQSPGKPQGVVIFALSRDRSGATLDPIVIINQGRYTPPPTGQSGDGALTRFAAAYYRPGRQYNVLFGGGAAGLATVTDWLGRDQPCARTEAAARLDSQAPIVGRVMALATNASSLGRRAITRRAPTPRERAAMYDLARRLYEEKDVPAALLAGLRQLNVTATDLDGDRRAEMVCTFLIKKEERPKAAHILFFIAEPRGAGYRAAFTKYGRITERDAGGPATLDQVGRQVLPEVYIDQADFDLDGTGEVVIADIATEGVIYRILRRQSGQWRQVYEFSNHKCGN